MTVILIIAISLNTTFVLNANNMINMSGPYIPPFYTTAELLITEESIPLLHVHLATQIATGRQVNIQYFW